MTVTNIELEMSSAEAELSIKLLFVFWPLLIRIRGRGSGIFGVVLIEHNLSSFLWSRSFGILFLVISTLMVSIIGLLALSILPRVDVSTISTYFFSLFYNIRLYVNLPPLRQLLLFSKTSSWGIIVCIQFLFAKLIFIKYNGQWL